MALRGRKFILLFFFLASTFPAACFDLAECRKYISRQLDSGTLSPSDISFQRAEDGKSPSENLVLTVPGCERLCGPGISWYQDTGPRLTTWIIPVLILASNMEVSPLDKRKYLTIFHLLGDPIDSLWSLLVKVQVWNRFRYPYLRLSGNDLDALGIDGSVLGTLLGALEELTAANTDPMAALRELLNGADFSNELNELMNETALELANTRTENILRTCLAVILYFWQVVSSFVPGIGGGNTSLPAGRIGTAAFMTWTIPIILLSNIIGGFPSDRSCFLIMHRFASRIPRLEKNLSANSEQHTCDISRAIWGRRGFA